VGKPRGHYAIARHRKTTAAFYHSYAESKNVDIKEV
jgi:hypothetical protein